jgi:hypothetical protein
MALRQLLFRWNQWCITPEFRIEPDGNALLAALAASNGHAKSNSSDSETPAPGSLNVPTVLQAPASSDDSLGQGPPEVATNGRSGHMIDETFVTNLCNGYFRLVANVGQLDQSDSRQLRNIRRAIAKMSELFEEHQIECTDFAGQAFDPGRNDVEVIGEAEERPGVSHMQIERCDRPAVFWKGKLIQRARAIVVKPLSEVQNNQE